MTFQAVDNVFFSCSATVPFREFDSFAEKSGCYHVFKTLPVYNTTSTCPQRVFHLH